MSLIEDRFEDSLIIGSRDTRSVLVLEIQGGYALPIVSTAAHHSADVRPTRLAIREQLGLDAVVLSCRKVSVADRVVHRLLELDLLDDFATRSDMRWLRADDLRHFAFADPASAAAVEDWFRAAAQPPGSPDGRDWTIPGWWTRATTWITQQVRAAGLGGIRAIEQVRAWEFSCVLQVETDQETLYFKALPDSYASEPPLAHQLAQWAPTFVPEVLAVERRTRWLLMRACHGYSLESGAPLATWERVAGAYAELQIRSTAHLATLRELGCRERGPRELRTLIGPLVEDHAALLGGTEHGLTAEEAGRLEQLRPRFEAACDELALSGLPLALEHGDLWDSNVYVANDRIAFIDWTDASLAHPFFSLMPLLVSAEWDPTLSKVLESRQRIVDAYLERWTKYAARERLRRALTLALPLAAIHIAATYWRDIPQPHSQWWIERMVPFFLRLALAEWDRV
jgi:hypothetical protein